MEVRINKEVRNYQESLFFGLSLYIRSEFLFPRRLVFRSDNIYAKALENSTIKEALKLD